MYFNKRKASTLTARTSVEIAVLFAPPRKYPMSREDEKLIGSEALNTLYLGLQHLERHEEVQGIR